MTRKSYPWRFLVCIDSQDIAEKLYRLARSQGRTSSRQAEAYIRAAVDAEYDLLKAKEDQGVL